MPSYKKLDLFQTTEYWEDITTNEYTDKHGNRNTNYTPNKDQTLLNNTKIFYRSISSIFKTIIDEYILLYSNAPIDSHVFDSELIKYCWTFLHKADQQVHSYFKDQFSKPATYKTIAFVLYCQFRALIRKNSSLHKIEIKLRNMKYEMGNVHKYCINTANRICHKYQDKEKNHIKTEVHSLRAQLNYVWMPLVLIGNPHTDIRRYMISDTETLFCWLGRLFCKNKCTNKYASVIDELSAKIESYETDRQSIISPHLKRKERGAYNSEFAQQIVQARAATKISRHQFRPTANTFMSFLSPTVNKLAGIPTFPCGNTIRKFESIVRASYDDVIKNKISSAAKPCTVSSDAVKKLGVSARRSHH